MALTDMLSYTTVKVARIKDPKLGALHYSFMFLILVYIIIYKVIMNTGYIAFEAPVGTVRMQLQAPMATCDGALCDPDYPMAKTAIPAITTLGYCGPDSASCGKPGSKCACRYQDASDVVFPVTGGSPFYIATRVTNWTEIPNPECTPAACSAPYLHAVKAGETYAACAAKCGANHFDGGCNATANCWNQERWYVAGVEDFTILIDHNVEAPSFDLSGTSATMSGSLLSCGTHMKPNMTKQNQDFFSVKTLLDAAQFSDGEHCGVDLDAKSNTDSHTVRYDGMILILSIEYSNVDKWKGTRAISYEYSVKVVKGAKSKVEQLTMDGQTRVLSDKHGIKIVVLQTGSLGQYNTTTLLLLLTASMAMLAAATTIVDFMMLYVLKNRHTYEHEKITEVNPRLLTQLSGASSSIYSSHSVQGGVQVE